jgi:hypothetical protein
MAASGLFVSKYQPSPQDIDDEPDVSTSQEHRRAAKWRAVTKLYHVITSERWVLRLRLCRHHAQIQCDLSAR